MATLARERGDAASAADPVAYLMVRAQLEDLSGNYCRAIDRRDWDLLRSVYHADAHDEHGTAYQGDVEGFIAAMPALMGDFEVTQHQITSRSYRVFSDHAEGELYFQAYHRTISTREHVVVHGRYLDRYEDRGGGWKIAQRKLVWDAFITTPVAPTDTEALASLGHGGRQGDDYSYACLPSLARGG